MTHPDFALLASSWTLALEADAYAPRTVRNYTAALTSLTGWLDSHAPGLAPGDMSREHVRGWLVHVRTSRSSATARAHFSGIRHFCRFLVAEGEAEADATAGIRTPPPGDPETRVLDAGELRRLLATCAGQGFVDRRDLAILLLFVDGGLRLGELAGLDLAAVDLRDRMVYVTGKGSRRSGPRHRAVPLGIKAARSLDRYVRARRAHPWADAPRLWLGGRGRATLTDDGIARMLERRAAAAGLKGLHPHAWRDRQRSPPE